MSCVDSNQSLTNEEEPINQASDSDPERNNLAQQAQGNYLCFVFKPIMISMVAFNRKVSKMLNKVVNKCFFNP